MRTISLIIIMLIIGIPVHSQINTGFFRTNAYSYGAVEVGFDKDSVVLTFHYTGGDLSNGDKLGYKIEGTDNVIEVVFDYPDTIINLADARMSFYLDSAEEELLKTNGLNYYYFKLYPFFVKTADKKKIASAVEKARYKEKDQWVSLKTTTPINLKFDYDVDFTPIIEIEMLGDILTQGDTLGIMISKSETSMYYNYDNEDWLDLQKETEYFELDDEDIKLITENGLGYLFINDMYFFFNKDDKKLIAKMAKDKFL